MKNITILSGSSSKTLAASIAQTLQLQLANCFISRFPDQEIKIQLLADLRKQRVIIIQATSPPANDHLMELLFLADAAKQAGALHITAVMPYFGYARANQPPPLAPPYSPTSAKVVTNMLSMAGINQIITVDIHNSAVLQYLPNNFISINPNLLFAADILRRNISTPIIVAPDLGSRKRAQDVAAVLNTTNVVLLQKHTSFRENLQVKKIYGAISKQPCIIVDDIVDSGSTICSAAELLHRHGAAEVIAYCTHPILSAGTLAKIQDSPINLIVVGNSVPLQSSSIATAKVRQLDLAPIIAAAIADTIG